MTMKSHLTNIKRYSELIKLKTFEERFNYLKIFQKVGEQTFGYNRYLNQFFYRYDPLWDESRNFVIARDKACDLACIDHPIVDIEAYDKKTGKKKIFKQNIIVHHMNPITEDDIENKTDLIYDPEFLITTILPTHNAIHYGDISLIVSDPIERAANDTCPWKI